MLDLGAARACEDEQADDVEGVAIQAVSFAFKQDGVQPGQFGGAEEALAVAIRIALDALHWVLGDELAPYCESEDAAQQADDARGGAAPAPGEWRPCAYEGRASAAAAGLPPSAAVTCAL